MSWVQVPLPAQKIHLFLILNCYALNMRNCKNCKKELLKRHQKVYCSNSCQIKYQHDEYIHEWKHGTVDGTQGGVVRNLSLHIKKYLIETYGEKCSMCHWNKTHNKTGKVPLEIDHIDGNSNNNQEDNLRLLCPNCHSLTPNYKNFNKGNGRAWRRDHYLKINKNPH
jgi:hypothetical protein